MAKQGTLLLIDQFGRIRGGQTVFLDILRILRPRFRRAVALFPRGGALEQVVAERFGRQVQRRHLPELRLSDGRKEFWDVLKLLLHTVLFLRHWPLLAQAELIYVNGIRLALPVFLASFFIPRRYVYHLHLDHSPLEKRLLALMVRSGLTHRMIVNSSFVYERLCAFDPRLADEPRLRVVENALSQAYSALPFADRFAGRQPGRLNVAVIGRICPQKGQDILLEVAARFPSMRFHVIGGVDPSQKGFADKLKAAVPGNVTFTGDTTDLTGTLNRLAIHVSLTPSRWEEPFGLVPIESMAHSCITLTSPNGALASVAKATCAWCFNSTQELCDMLRRLEDMGAAELRQVARLQHDRTMDRFGADRYARELLAAVMD